MERAAWVEGCALLRGVLRCRRFSFLPAPCLPAPPRWQAVYRVIPDERPLIEQTLKELCDVEGCSLVVTTGGTGPAPRDVTPEATEAVGSQPGEGVGEL